MPQLAVLFALSTLCGLVVPARASQEQAAAVKLVLPPGTVRVPGGRTRIGTPTAAAIALGQENEKLFENISRETPQFELKLDDFALGVTEVTNEQYLAYVQATQVTPPEAWGEAAIDKAFADFEAERTELARRAKEEGKPPPALKPFPRHQWWTENWRTSEWGLPKGEEARPVTSVDFEMALAYADWAGVRLMSEFEFQRAGRMDSKNAYPWGDKWDPSRCANQEQGASAPSPVGSFPSGASQLGIQDLSGNVWEWTSSPFRAYPGFKVLQIRVGAGERKRVVDALVRWDSEQRVVVGGSYNEGAYAARLTTRRPTDRDQAAEGLGFRVAASLTPGLDVAQSLLTRKLQPDARPRGVRYDETQIAFADHWSSAPGTAAMPVSESGGETRAPIPGYAVTTGYDFILFIPAADIELTALAQLDTRSVSEGPIHMGILSTTRPALVPPLPAGTWMVAFRGAGPVNERSPRPNALELPPDLDTRTRALIFYDISLHPLAWLPLEQVEFLHPPAPRVLIEPAEPSVEGSGAAEGSAEGGAEGRTVTGMTAVTLRVCSLVKVANKAFVYGIGMRFADGDVTPEWRH